MSMPTLPSGLPCKRFFLGSLLLLFGATLPTPAAENGVLHVGVAKVDITPDYPVRLNGFGFRRTESEGVTQPLWAKALAFADATDGPAILITTDNLCVPDEITQEIARRLRPKIGLQPERLSITATHTHTAPMLKDVAPTIFGTAIPPEHQEHIDRYTAEFIDKLEQAALAAVRDIRPSRVSWGIGRAGFASNRRTKDGPVDHDLPVLVVRDLDDKVRALYFSYACHCVTLSNNKFSGDWAGFAQDEVQKMFPNAIALASVGCGADSNPSSGVTGDKAEICAAQGTQIANEVKRLVAGKLFPLATRPQTRYTRIDIPFDTPRTRAEWEERAKSKDYAVAFHASLTLSRLDRGETLPTKMTYPIQTWLFGDQLALVFLPGETVVDYSLRLKREFDRTRLWVNGYANEGRCYLPSERVLREGGYEGGNAMIYYDRPQRFAPGLEQKIIDAVHSQIPASFAAPKGTEGTRPVSATESLRYLQTKPGLVVELVAAEPLVVDPVAIDWGRDGKLWVCQMQDYPTGLDQNWQPGGTVTYLEDTDGDGRYDKSTLFLDHLPFPTGVTAWGRGVLVCAAPDIFYAEDANGDGKADKIEKVFSGFFTDNFQARVNSLNLGLDNWIYGANGLLGGEINGYPGWVLAAGGRNSASSPSAVQPSVNIRNRDFRFHPFTGVFEPASGVTQQGRVRNDWDDWFGCDNSQALLFFPGREHYLRRNPHLPASASVVNLASRPDGNRVFPASQLLERFNDPDQVNRVTSACGLGIYRDTWLGEEYYGNAFTCEAVHNLVHREILTGDATGFNARRAADEQESEFLASRDNWFRPAQVRTGPDGALYVVDMYRFLIEHPRWIPAARLTQLDIRAGSDRGRIYRLKPPGKTLRAVPDLTKLSTGALAEALDSPNGTARDRVHLELLVRNDPTATAGLEKLSTAATLPQVRLQALSALSGLGQLSPKLVERSIHDPDARVRQHAVRLAETVLKNSPASAPDLDSLISAVAGLAGDPSRAVIQQLAWTLGEVNHREFAKTLARLATNFLNEPVIRNAVLSSANQRSGDLLDAVMAVEERAPGRSDWIEPLITMAAASKDEAVLARAFAAVLPTEGEPVARNHYTGLAALFDALDRQQMSFTQFRATHSEMRMLEPRLTHAIASARDLVKNSSAAPKDRAAALGILGRDSSSAEDRILLIRLALELPASSRPAAFSALRRQRGVEIAQRLIDGWPQTSPAIRTELLALLLEREPWARALLKAMQSGSIPPSELPLAEQQRLLRSENSELQQLASKLFQPSPERSEALRKYQASTSLPGRPVPGAEVFSRQCASCHAVGRTGHDVGPNLAALQAKDADYWIKNILDPNAVVEPRFVNYELELQDGRVLSGIIKSETASSVALAMAGGLSETILRTSLTTIRPLKTSLMPEGLEQGISIQEMADLLAFLKSGTTAPPSGPESVTGQTVLRNAPTVARLVLDARQPSASREAAVNANPQFSGDLITEMTRDLTPGTPEEYVRIPWIWRVAVACGKRNDANQLKRVLAASLPLDGEPLRDWQAVVLGGGLINGLSQRGLWPRARLLEVLAGDTALQARFERSLNLAAAMAANQQVRSGTRYDALRMLGIEPWEKRGAELIGFLNNSNEELQMGAVSALGDIQSPHAAHALLDAFPTLVAKNQSLAIDNLLRDEARASALAEALAASRIKREALTQTQLEKLKISPNASQTDAHK